MFKMLDPFFKFVLLDPKCPEQHRHLRSFLTMALLREIDDTADPVFRCQGVHYMVEIMYNMQVSKKNNVPVGLDLCCYIYAFVISCLL